MTPSPYNSSMFSACYDRFLYPPSLSLSKLLLTLNKGRTALCIVLLWPCKPFYGLMDGIAYELNSHVVSIYIYIYIYIYSTYLCVCCVVKPFIVLGLPGKVSVSYIVIYIIILSIIYPESEISHTGTWNLTGRIQKMSRSDVMQLYTCWQLW